MSKSYRKSSITRETAAGGDSPYVRSNHSVAEKNSEAIGMPEGSLAHQCSNELQAEDDLSKGNRRSDILRASQNRAMSTNGRGDRSARGTACVDEAFKTSPSAEESPTTCLGFREPLEVLPKVLKELESSSWEVIVKGLQNLVRFGRCHAEHLERPMRIIVIKLESAIRNLRSQVVRAGCQAAGEMFAFQSRAFDRECDEVVSALLDRTADTNRFLRTGAAEALDLMCDNLTPFKIMRLLSTKGAAHQNPLVRSTTAKLLNRLTERIGCEAVFGLPRDQRNIFFTTVANLLVEGSADSRNQAKAVFGKLRGHGSFLRVLKDSLPKRLLNSIDKVVKNINN